MKMGTNESHAQAENLKNGGQVMSLEFSTESLENVPQRKQDRGSQGVETASRGGLLRGGGPTEARNK